LFIGWTTIGGVWDDLEDKIKRKHKKRNHN